MSGKNIVRVPLFLGAVLMLGCGERNPNAPDPVVDPNLPIVSIIAEFPRFTIDSVGAGGGSNPFKYEPTPGLVTAGVYIDQPGDYSLIATLKHDGIQEGSPVTMSLIGGKYVADIYFPGGSGEWRVFIGSKDTKQELTSSGGNVYRILKK